MIKQDKLTITRQTILDVEDAGRKRKFMQPEYLSYNFL